jgi:rRNA-processing protein FCF1
MNVDLDGHPISEEEALRISRSEARVWRWAIEMADSYATEIQLRGIFMSGQEALRNLAGKFRSGLVATSTVQLSEQVRKELTEMWNG